MLDCLILHQDTIRSDPHDSKNTEHNFPLVEYGKRSLHEPRGTCFNLGKLAYMPVVIVSYAIWITFQFRTASEFNLVVLFFL